MNDLERKRPGKEQKQQASRSGDSVSTNAEGPQANNITQGVSEKTVILLIAFMILFCLVGAFYIGAVSNQMEAERREFASHMQRSENRITLTREFAVQVYNQVDWTMTRYGVAFPGPLDEHAPIAQTSYDIHDAFVRYNQEQKESFQ